MPHHSRPDYCPDDLREDEICPACGADPRPCVRHNWCNARHNGPRPRPLIQLVLIEKETGKVFAWKS